MNHGNAHLTRRTVMQGAAAGLVGTLTVPALASAQSADAGGTSAGQAALTNPKNDYAHPPFHSDEQPWPGLASRMTPKPDHGDAIANFSKGLAKQLVAQGIRVNAVAPGPFWTALQWMAQEAQGANE